MKLVTKNKIIIPFIIFLFISSCFIPLSSPEIVSLPETINGKILFTPMDSTTTYLIDTSGTINHEWESNFLPGESVKWLGDGTILRTIKTGIYGYGGAGGGVQKVLWDGSIVWDFRYDTNGNLSHHDITILPNGNILMIAWETKTRDEAIDAGINPSTFVGNIIMPDHLIEVKPTGPASGEIVWEWHVWDHLIQDYDASKPNYGVVENHPELIDINYEETGLADINRRETQLDMMHTNSIDYNPAVDQILISVHTFNEIWVIDHSTTTEEAVGHSGGHSGKGGDILYRWGNPQAYHRGTINDRNLFGQHDASWIKPGLPGAGHILVFNNGEFDPIPPITTYSTVDEIIPPINETGKYYLSPGSAYGPEDPTWRYIADPPTSFQSILYSGAQRLSNGNTLICDGVAGRFFEVTPSGTTVWEYTNPYPTPSLNNVFKIVYIPQDEQPGLPNLMCTGSLSWNDVEPGQIVTGSFQIHNIGASGSRLNWTIVTSSLGWGTWSFTPEDGKNLTPAAGEVTVHVSVKAPAEKNSEFTGDLRVVNTNDPEDFEVIPVSLITPADSQPYVFRWTFLQQFFYKIQEWRPLFLKGWFDYFLIDHIY